MNTTIISGYETKTYYLPFEENHIRFGQVVTQKYPFWSSMSQDHSFQGLIKCRITMHKNKFVLLLLKGIWKGNYWLVFYQLKVLCNTSFVSSIKWFSSFFFYFSHCISMSFIVIIFPTWIKLWKWIAYDKIDDCGQLSALKKKTYYWPWSLWKVFFTWFYIIWQAFRLSGTTFARKVCMTSE